MPDSAITNSLESEVLAPIPSIQGIEGQAGGDDVSHKPRRRPRVGKDESHNEAVEMPNHQLDQLA